MIQVNLIPDLKLQVIQARALRFRVILISIFLSLFFVAMTILLALYTYGAQTLQNNNLDSQITSEVDKFNSVADISKLLTIQNQLQAIPITHTTKNITSRVFDILPPVITSSGGLSYISSQDIDLKTNSIKITGYTSNYATFESFLKALQSCYIQYTEKKDSTDYTKKGLVISFISGQASLGKSSNGSSSVSFVFSFNYPDELFKQTIFNVSFGIDKSGNVSDSFNGIPSTIISRKGI